MKSESIDEVCGQSPGSFRKCVRFRENYLRLLELERSFRSRKSRDGLFRASFTRLGMKLAWARIRHFVGRRGRRLFS